VRVTLDKENLYLGYECLENEPQKLRQDCTVKNSEGIFRDDVVEAYLRPPVGEGVEIAANAANTIRVRGKVNPVSATRVGERSWVVEMAIPLKDLGVQESLSGKTWRGNFARRRVGPPIELSTWCRVEERLGDARAFGELRFAL
jgi:hypothetical protein